MPNTDTSAHASARVHAFDAIRACAVFGVVLAHATISFMPGFSTVGWPIVDNQPSQALALLYYVIHMCRLTAYFLIAGYVAHVLLHAKGTRAFGRERCKRILVPLVVGWILLVPPIVVALVIGAQRSGVAVQAAAQAAARAPRALAFPLAHLWFLYLLLLLYAIAIGVRFCLMRWLDRSGTQRARIDAGVRWLVERSWSPLLFAAPSAAALYLSRPWTLWMGMPTPDESLIPEWPPFITYGLAFSLGWFMHRQPDLLHVWERRWRTNLAIAGVCTVLSLSIVGPYPSFTPIEPGLRLLLYAVTYAIGLWSWMFMVIGASVRFFSKANETIRYVADSSYWLYLTHYPVMLFLQLAVMQWNTHWSLKFAFIVSVALVLLFTSYHFLVRPTGIGQILNGRKHVRVPAMPVAETSASA